MQRLEDADVSLCLGDPAEMDRVALHPTQRTKIADPVGMERALSPSQHALHPIFESGDAALQRSADHSHSRREAGLLPIDILIDVENGAAFRTVSDQLFEVGNRQPGRGNLVR